MRLCSFCAILYALAQTTFATDSKPLKPCTIVSPTSGDYYDLNTITVQPLKDHKKAHKHDRTESWLSRGYDYGTNFTLNFCAPVIETLVEVVGINEALWQNVSAFYKLNGQTYSIG